MVSTLSAQWVRARELPDRKAVQPEVVREGDPAGVGAMVGTPQAAVALDPQVDSFAADGHDEG